MNTRTGLIDSSALALRLAILVDGAFGAATLAGLAASLALGGRFTTMLLGDYAGAAFDARTAGLRWLLVLGVAMAGLIFVMLRALRRIVATVQAGDPFVGGNAARLRTIGWSLVAIQLLDIPAALIARGFPALGSAAPDAGISPAGWLAVLMSFVLARVFAVGAGMRDDLEGTV